jgi:hypothetical protein
VLRDVVADFTIGSPGVASLRLDLLVVEPALTVPLWLLEGR